MTGAQGRPFIILGEARTGSMLLRDLLGSHPLIFAGGEPFQDQYDDGDQKQHAIATLPDGAALLDLLAQHPLRFLERFLALADAGERALGFKLFYSQLDRLPEVRELLVARGDLQVIHLRRRNALRRYLSLQRAVRSGIWFELARLPKPPPQPIRLDPAHCREVLEQTLRQERVYDRLFARHHRLELSYEELAAAPFAAAARTIAFLGLPPCPRFELKLRKSATDRLREAIANYDELKAALPDWQACFDD